MVAHIGIANLQTKLGPHRLHGHAIIPFLGVEDPGVGDLVAMGVDHPRDLATLVWYLDQTIDFALAELSS